MIFLLLAISLNTYLFVAFKVFERWKVDNLQAVVANYWVCVATDSIFIGRFPVSTYSATTAAALASAEIAEQWVRKESGNRMQLCNHDGCILQQDLQLFCIVYAAIPLHLADEYARCLSDLCGVSVKPPL